MSKDMLVIKLNQAIATADIQSEQKAHWMARATRDKTEAQLAALLKKVTRLKKAPKR